MWTKARKQDPAGLASQGHLPRQQTARGLCNRPKITPCRARTFTQLEMRVFSLVKLYKRRKGAWVYDYSLAVMGEGEGGNEVGGVGVVVSFSAERSLGVEVFAAWNRITLTVMSSRKRRDSGLGIARRPATRSRAAPPKALRTRCVLRLSSSNVNVCWWLGDLSKG